MPRASAHDEAHVNVAREATVVRRLQGVTDFAWGMCVGVPSEPAWSLGATAPNLGGRSADSGRTCFLS
jgi:hypothetical protein